MKVITIERPPFVFYEDDKLTGFSIELLESIKQRLGLTYNIKVANSFSEMLSEVKNKNVDFAIANISITAEREKSMDFSYPIYKSGIQLLAKKQDTSLFSIEKMKSIFLIFGILIAVSILIKRANKNTGVLGNIPHSAYLMVMWIIGGGWMVISFSSQLGTGVHASSDRDPIFFLKGKEIGTSVGTTMSKFLDKNNIAYTPYDDYKNALDSLENGEIEILLGDAAVTKYYTRHDGKEKVIIIGEVFENDDIGIAFKTRYSLKKKINQTILRIKEDGTYGRLMLKYFGEEY